MSVTSVGEQLIVAKLDSPDPQAAARALSAVADAYLHAQGEQRTSTVAGLAELRTQRDARAAARAAAEKALADYKTQANALLYGDPYDFNSVDEPNSLAEYLRDYY